MTTETGTERPRSMFWLAAEWLGLLGGVALIRGGQFPVWGRDAIVVLGMIAALIGLVCGLAVILVAVIQVASAVRHKVNVLPSIGYLAMGTVAPILAWLGVLPLMCLRS